MTSFSLSLKKPQVSQHDTYPTLIRTSQKGEGKSTASKEIRKARRDVREVL